VSSVCTEFLYPGYRISRRTEGSDIIWDVSMPDVPTDWGSPITAPWGAQIWFWFQTADSSFNPDLYPAPRLVVSDEPQE
jgi:hypothetical protein